jgi:hypothetical protein
MMLLRYLDLGVLAIALVVFLAAGLPIEGWLLAAGVWALWRGIGELGERRAAATRDPRRVVGIATASMIGRGWLMAALLLGVGLVLGDDVGLSAAVLCVVLFTVSFTSRAVLRPFSTP